MYKEYDCSGCGATQQSTPELCESCKGYFRNFTPERLSLYALYLYKQGVTDTSRAMTDEEIAREYSGDDHIEVVYEDNANLVVLSVDSNIKVLNCIRKNDIEHSESVELS